MSTTTTPRQIYIAIIGTGGVGRAFLSQLEAVSHRFLSQPNPPATLSLISLSRSSKALHRDFTQPISFSSWSVDLDASTTKPLAPAKLAEYLAGAPQGSRAVLVDNTSDVGVAEAYPEFLRRGISVVTPNKKAFSSDLALWTSIFSCAANGSGPRNAGYVFHESTVGAGLPVLSTLKELLETGDVVTRIEGVFSGTMSFLFNSFMPVSGGAGGAFSAEVKKAKELGYTEPDPRDDLNGLDVARKLTILARIAGLPLDNPTSFPVQSLIPAALESCASGDEFLARLPEFDDQVETAKKEAEAEGKVLRYVGSIDVAGGKVEVGLKAFGKAHPIAGLKGSDNIISFYTRRYGGNPLIVQGAGAGGEVTAMGVLGDLIRVVRLVG